MRKKSTLFFIINRFGKSREHSEISINDARFGECDIMKEPSPESIENILNFARSYDAKKTKSAGYVEFNLN